MQDRRQTTRDKVLYGGVAKSGETGASKDCVVRNISEKGANIEFSNVVKFPKEQMSLTVARKGRSFLAKVVWWRDNFVGVAFSGAPLLRPNPISMNGCVKAKPKSASCSAGSRNCSAKAKVLSGANIDPGRVSGTKRDLDALVVGDLIGVGGL
jgi:hypothetical protein